MWLHKFAETAEKALAAEYARQGLDTKEERSSFVLRLLGDVQDMSAKNRPFLWETVYDDPKAKKEVRSIYHSAATWASHS